MNEPTQTLFNIRTRLGRLRGDPLERTRLAGISIPIVSGKGLAAGSCSPVSWRRQRAHGADARIPSGTRLEIGRCNSTGEDRTHQGRIHLRDRYGYAAEQGRVVRRHLVVSRPAGWVRSRSGSRVRAIRLPQKNASLIPLDGTATSLIVPRDGTEGSPTVPGDGTIRANFRPSPVPLDGIPLEKPSTTVFERTQP